MDASQLAASEQTFAKDAWQRQPPYHQHRPAFENALTASCHCRLVQFQVRGEPRSVKICHCKTCQVLHGAPFRWTAEFRKEDINFLNGARDLAWYDPQTRAAWHRVPCKVKCTHCHTPVMDENAESVLVFPAMFRFRSKEEGDKFEPRERALNVEDGNPKWAGEAGRSDVLNEVEEHGALNTN